MQIDLRFDQTKAAAHSGAPQRIRVMSEDWTQRNLYCLNCASPRLFQLPPNTQARDFSCTKCNESYELKAGAGPAPATLNDGALSAMLRRLENNEAPNLVVLRYHRPSYTVIDLFVVPRHFLTEDIVQPRNPLALTARRAGWVGCKLRLDQIPVTGRVSIISAGQDRPAETCRDDWRRTLFLRRSGDGRRWLLAIMSLIDQLPTEFVLQDVYGFTAYLEQRFPSNAHIHEKIRQQLQVLRDEGHLTFLSRGRYRRNVCA